MESSAPFVFILFVPPSCQGIPSGAELCPTLRSRCSRSTPTSSRYQFSPRAHKRHVVFVCISTCSHVRTPHFRLVGQCSTDPRVGMRVRVEAYDNLSNCLTGLRVPGPCMPFNSRNDFMHTGVSCFSQCSVNDHFVCLRPPFQIARSRDESLLHEVPHLHRALHSGSLCRLRLGLRHLLCLDSQCRKTVLSPVRRFSHITCSGTFGRTRGDSFGTAQKLFSPMCHRDLYKFRKCSPIVGIRPQEFVRVASVPNGALLIGGREA